MATRITIIEESPEPVYDPGLPGALKSIFTVVLLAELIYLFTAVKGSVEKWQWLVLLFAADIFFWIAMVSVFHTGFEGTGLLLRAVLKSLKIAAIALGVVLLVTLVLIPLLPPGIQTFIDGVYQWFTTGAVGKGLSWLFRLALTITGIIGSLMVLKKKVIWLRYSRGMKKAVGMLEISSTAAIILLMGWFILLPLLGVRH